jgi:hypothetical protein
LPRRWIADLMHASRGVPLVSFERHMDVSAVAAARRQLADPPGWCAIFTKAYGIVTLSRPELRTVYMTFPWPRLYEHPHSIASVAVERHWHGEPAVFFGLILQPGKQPLEKMERYLRRFKEAPVDEIGDLRRLVQTARYPRLIRRLLWWYGLNWSGNHRAKNAGTFGVSVTAGLGASAVKLISPLTTTLNYGPLDEAGWLNVVLHFDHRVIDGAPIARALAHLEHVLNNEIVSELRALQSPARLAVSSCQRLTPGQTC